jgi:PKD domain
MGMTIRASKDRRVAAHGLAVIVLGVAALLLAVAPAWAAPTWLAPVKLSAAGIDAEQPDVAVDAQGDALSVWVRGDVVEASSGSAAGPWQAPVTISGNTEKPSVPQVALDSHGDAVATWLSLDAGHEYHIQVATRSGVNGTWKASELKNVGMSAIEPGGPDVAIDPQGDAVVVWPREETFIEASSRPAGGVFETPEELSKTAAAQHAAKVAIDSAGRATAVWEESDGKTVIDVASKSLGGTWEPGKPLSNGAENANEPRVAVNARGDAVALWEQPNGGNEVLEAATNPASSGKWGNPAAVTNGAIVIEPAGQELAIDAQGDAVVVWSWLVGKRDVVEATEGNAASSIWKASVALSPLGATEEEMPQVAVNAQGNAVVVWERSTGANVIIEAASGLAASGSWQPPVPLSAAGENAAGPQVALYPPGDAAAVWQRSDGKNSIAEAAAYDVGPLQNSLSIPGAGTVGQALSFSVSPLSSLVALGATSWAFGDGASQVGTAVAHTYAAAGSYPVTVKTADALGVSTSASANVVIGAAAKPAFGAGLTPRITGAHLSHSRFRVSKQATAISAKVKSKLPQGTSFEFTLSEAARVQIAFTRSAAGLRSDGRCVAPSTKLRHQHAKHCSRTLTIGTLSRAKEQPGNDSLAFSGRIGTKALAAGSYRAILTANTSGLSSSPVTLSLTIVH